MLLLYGVTRRCIGRKFCCRRAFYETQEITFRSASLAKLDKGSCVTLQKRIEGEGGLRPSVALRTKERYNFLLISGEKCLSCK